MRAGLAADPRRESFAHNTGGRRSELPVLDLPEDQPSKLRRHRLCSPTAVPRSAAYSQSAVAQAKQWVTIGVASVAALVLAHHAVYLVSHPVGPIGALEREPHIDAWSGWSAVVAAAGLTMLILAIVRLREVARPRGGARKERPRLAAHVVLYAQRTAGWWLRLLIGVTALYVAWEQVEALRAGLPAPGLAALLSGSHGAALPLIAVATFVTAAVISLADWCRCALLERLRAPGITAHHTGRHEIHAGIASDSPLASAILARRSWGRPPPR